MKKKEQRCRRTKAKDDRLCLDRLKTSSRSARKGTRPYVAHWSLHWQEPSQVPSKIYLSVLWCWHNVFLISEIRLCVDEKAPLFLPYFHLISCYHLKHTRWQANIPLNPTVYLFKESVLREGVTPYWSRHCRISFFFFTLFQNLCCDSFCFHWATMKTSSISVSVFQVL